MSAFQEKKGVFHDFSSGDVLLGPQQEKLPLRVASERALGTGSEHFAGVRPRKRAGEAGKWGGMLRWGAWADAFV